MSKLDFNLILGYFNSRDYQVEKIEQISDSLLIQSRLRIKTLGTYVYCPVINVVYIDFDSREIVVQFAYDTLNNYIKNNRLYDLGYTPFKPNV